MRKFNITVNGKTYEVDVEEVGGASAAAYAAPAAAAPVQAAPAAAPAPSAPAPKPAPSAGAGTPVKAPMPGTIVSVKVNVGDTVNKDTLVAVLEAMKMENEIFAGVEGTVTGIATNAGASVNSGDTIITVG